MEDSRSGNGRIGILVPTLNRPESIGPLAANIAETTPVGRYQLIFVLDHADRESREAVRSAEFCRYILCDGSLPVKTNAGYRASNDEFVLPTADDVWFRAGWFEAVLAEFENPAVHVVGTDDTTPSTASREFATMPVIRSSYIEDPGAVWNEPGIVFWEGYHHNAVELETCGLAQHRDCWAWAEDAVIEHRHPDWGTRELDDTDWKGNRQERDLDRARFEARQTEWSRS